MPQLALLAFGLTMDSRRYSRVCFAPMPARLTQTSIRPRSRTVRSASSSEKSRMSAAALGAIFDATAPELLRVAMSLVGAAGEADDLLQDTFLTAIERAGAARTQPLRPPREPPEREPPARYTTVASPLASVEAYDDERTFIDHGRSVNVLTRRHVLKDLIR